MKTLLLTSQGLNVKSEILKILPKTPKELNLIHIITASKDEKDKGYVSRDTEKMEGLGFKVTEVDLEGLAESEVREKLKDADVIYVQGGNTFFLLKCVKESGFDNVVKELVEKGTIYIGKSAGTYIACPTIEQSSWTHDHNKFGLRDLTGLSLVPFMIYVHFVPGDREVLKGKIPTCNFEVRILTDNQAILVQGDNYKLVGTGPEIKI